MASSSAGSSGYFFGFFSEFFFFFRCADHRSLNDAIQRMTYMIKPINMQEMVFRVKALLRRSKIVNEKKLKVGDTILDYDALTIKINDNLYNMPPKEFYLIFKLLSSPNKIFTRIELMDEIWGMDTDIDDRTIDSHIKKLRRKFEDCSDFEIVTVRGLGYKSKINV